MDNKEINRLERDGIEIIQDEDGNVINYDTNEEVNAMGKGDEEDEK